MMYEVVWQYDENEPHRDEKPADADAARRRLLAGNEEFASFFAPHRQAGETTRHIVKVTPQDVGISGRPGQAPRQTAFAAFLSCADARVPVELIFGQKANDLFVVRVAGNVLGDESLGSLDFAVGQLGTVRLLAVLGHTGCGAVTAAVDAYLMPVNYVEVAANLPLQAIISKLLPPTRGAAASLAAVYGDGVARQPGFRQALIESTVILNAALSAAVLNHTFAAAVGDRLEVCFGVYDLRHRNVGLPGEGEMDDWQVGLFAPPASQEAFNDFGRRIARSRLVRELIDA